ncbi:hypothetical protein [Streptomyces sp. NPDC058412]|uniref:hypothetical protein n=1 Tax=Streptomyces sp. NPDC058412 TaxID=3346486 RepID=UPI00364B4CBB
MTSWTAAHAITTRWHDHQRYLTSRWHHRLDRLMAANAHLNRPGNASAVLLARALVTYPETVALAHTLATLPRPARPHENRTTAPGATRGAAHDALTVIAHRLQLPTPTPTSSDPLHAYLTHTRR